LAGQWRVRCGFRQNGLLPENDILFSIGCIVHP
jgi:hypothetical protein